MFKRQRPLSLIFLRKLLNLPRKMDVIGNGYVATITTLPRTPDPPYVAPRKKKEKRTWSFPISIFKEWRKDDEVK